MNLFKKTIACGLFLVAAAGAYENRLFQETVPGFGFYYQSKVGVEESRHGVQGTFGKVLQVVFVSEYGLLDSIYRQSFSEIDVSYRRGFALLGLGYGLSMEWDHRGDFWTRHRYRLGGTFSWRELYLGGMVAGWTDELGDRAEVLLGGGVVTGEMLEFHFQWDGSLVELGSSINFTHCRLDMSYVFPGFGLSISLHFFWDTWGTWGEYRLGNHSLDEFEVGVSKRFRKKTIL